MKCASCDKETTGHVEGLGYPCFHCYTVCSLPDDIVCRILRDPEISWWVMDGPRKWRRASIDQQEQLEQLFQHFVHNLISD